MASNLMIKSFDTELGNLINHYINNGIDISVVSIVLNKYLAEARNVEEQVLENERKEILARQEQEKQNMIQREVNEFINSNPEDVATKEVAGEPVGDMCDADCNECNCNNEDPDPDWENEKE